MEHVGNVAASIHESEKSSLQERKRPPSSSRYEVKSKVKPTVGTNMEVFLNDVTHARKRDTLEPGNQSEVIYQTFAANP